MQLVVRYYAPFDVRVVRASANSLGGISGTLGNTQDSYVLIAGITTTSGTIDTNLWGQANGKDIDDYNNNRDTVVVLANNVFQFAGANDSTAGLALAQVVAHEAGHSFGLVHTYESATSSVVDTLARTDMMGQFANAGDPSLTQLSMFTRFPLATVNSDGSVNSTVTEVPFDVLARNLFLRPNAPGYVTGTGYFNRITLTRITSTDLTSVTVDAYQDPSRTSFLRSYGYLINSANRILVETGYGADQIVVDANIGTPVTIHGHGGNDEILVQGNNSMTGSYTPGARTTQMLIDTRAYVGGHIVAGRTTIDFDEFSQAGSVVASGFSSFTFNTPNLRDVITLDNPAAGQEKVSGTSDKIFLTPLTVNNVPNFTINTGVNRSNIANDAVTIWGTSSGVSTRIVTGIGNDTIQVGADYVPLRLDGSLSIDGGAGLNNQLTFGNRH